MVREKHRVGVAVHREREAHERQRRGGGARGGVRETQKGDEEWRGHMVCGRLLQQVCSGIGVRTKKVTPSGISSSNAGLWVDFFVLWFFVFALRLARPSSSSTCSCTSVR